MYDEWVTALKEAADDKSVVVTVVTGKCSIENDYKLNTRILLYGGITIKGYKVRPKLRPTASGQ